MKKAFVFAVAAFMLLTLGACGEKKTAEEAVTDFALVYIHELPDGSAELLDTALFI